MFPEIAKISGIFHKTGLWVWLVSCPFVLADEPATWSIQATPIQKEILTREPVEVALSWRNTSPGPRTLLVNLPQTVAVAKDGDQQQRFLIFRPGVNTKAAAISAQVNLAPGETFSQTFRLLLGQLELDWLFLWDAAGTYTLTFPELGTDPFTLVVREPASDVDRQARALFSVAAAKVFLGEDDDLDSGSGQADLQRIFRQFPGSYLGPSSAIGLAETAWRSQGGFRLDFPAYRGFLDLLIEDRQRHPFRELAFFLLAQGFAYQPGQKQKVAETLERLRREYPDSPFIQRIQQSFEVNGAPLVPRQRGAGTKLEWQGIDLIPPGPREAFAGFWQGLAAADLDTGLGFFDPDFICDEGGLAELRAKLLKFLGEYDFHLFRVEVSSFRNVARYAHPDRTKSWRGELGLVSYRLASTFTDKETGRSQDETTPARVALIASVGGDWRILADLTNDRNNLIATPLAVDLYNGLRLDFASVKVWNGKKTVFLYEEIRALFPDLLGQRLAWTPLRLEMRGAAFDMPWLEGFLRSKSGDAPNRVSLSFTLDGNRLRLVDIQNQASN